MHNKLDMAYIQHMIDLEEAGCEVGRRMNWLIIESYGKWWYQ
jgi:hypothetical protein